TSGQPVPAVSSLMTPLPVVTIRAGDTLENARLLMRLGHLHHLPVVDDDRLVGMLALHDVLMTASSDRPATVGGAMTRAPLAQVEPDTEAAGAGGVLLRRHI